jgi:peptidoglycan LD-endopeptidase LytH
MLASSCRSGRGSGSGEPELEPVPDVSLVVPPQMGPAAESFYFDPAKGTVTLDDLDRLHGRRLAVPVAGKAPADVPNSFFSGRSGGRRHNAADILAARGTAVLSADDGRVQRLSSNALGGITIYATDPEARFVYYYAHLDRYAVGLRVGQRIQRGDLLGYVGTTGNAPPNAPHLHFQIMRLLDRARLWDGVPIDPKPFLVLPGAVR